MKPQLVEENQKPAICGPKQDDEHPCPRCYMSQACIAGGFLVWFLFLARIYTAACKSNEKTMGERAREREREKPPQLTPWDFWNAPSSLVKGGIWLTCDVTCLEVWQLSKTTVTLIVCSVHVCFFFQRFVLIWYLGMDFVYQNGISLLGSKFHLKIKRLKLLRVITNTL